MDNSIAGTFDDENDSKLSSCLRKRRTASLVAEALWNIQMEEDMNANGKHITENMQDLHACGNTSLWNGLSSTPKSCWKSVKPVFNRVMSSKAVAVQQNTASCLHMPTCSRKLLNNSMRSRKPMASVVPLVKSECRESGLPEGWHRTTPPKSSSQVLLLPISIDSGVNTAVPILALNPGSMGLDFMNCLNASTLVDVTLASVNSGVSLKKSSCQMYSFPQLDDLNCSKSCACKNGVTDHQALRQKSRVRIQSGLGLHSSKVKHTHKCQVEKSEVMKEECLPSLILSSCLKPSSNMQISGTTVTSIAGKNARSTRSKESRKTFVAFSPSSESSGSVELDDSNTLVKSEGRQKKNISLRLKAAPPPGKAVVPSSMTRLSHQLANCNNGWTWSGRPYKALVFSTECGGPVVRICYPSIRRKMEPPAVGIILCDDSDCYDIIMVRDCVVMRADGGEQPYIAKVAALWEQPSTGQMMISLLWFYRPEHIVDTARVLENHHDDELFASKHLDEISVECVEDKCYVLTYSQYCRYMAESVRAQDHTGASDGRKLVPTVISHPHCRKPHLVLPADTSRSLVFFCQKLYDIKSHRLLKTFPLPTTLFYASSSENSL